MGNEPTLLLPLSYGGSADRAVLDYMRDRMPDRVHELLPSSSSKEAFLWRMQDLFMSLLEPGESVRITRKDIDTVIVELTSASGGG